MRHSYLVFSLLLLVGCDEAESEASVDSGISGADAGIASDAGSTGADAGSPASDAGVFVDSGAPELDAGLLIDAGGADDASAEEFDAAVVADAGLVADAGAQTDAGRATFQSFTPCPTARSYVSTHSVSFGRGTYNPACVVIVAGESVTIPGSATHPRAPSLAGTRGNPITAGITDATITFPSPGFFPYYCTVHGADGRAGPSGMAGVIQVLDDTAGGT